MFMQSIGEQFDNVILTFPEAAQTFFKRIDNKLICSIDTDGYINKKFKWLNVKYEAPPKIREPNAVVYLNNDKGLSHGLEKLLSINFFWQEQISICIPFFLDMLAYNDCMYYKCEIFDTEDANRVFPVAFDSRFDFISRTFIRFTQTDKKRKEYISKSPSLKKGELRLTELITIIY